MFDCLFDDGVISSMLPPTATADLCLQSMPEYSDQRNGNSVAHFTGKTQAIIPDYSFTCSGNVTRWGAYVEPGGSSEEYHVNFQVWRPSHLAGCYALVGNNRLQRATPADNQITLEVPEEEQIQVQPRDVMGFYIQHLGGRSGGIQLLASVGADSVSVWHAGEIMSTDTGTCRLSVGEGGTLSSMIDRKPVVTAVVSKYTSTLQSHSQGVICMSILFEFTSYTHTGQESPTNTPLSSSTATFATLPADPTETADTAVTSAVFLILGAIIGCTVTVITAVAIAIYVMRKKRASKKAMIYM